jgi:hypothetical protein
LLGQFVELLLKGDVRRGKGDGRIRMIWHGEKLQTSNSKLQGSSKHQDPNGRNC